MKQIIIFLLVIILLIIGYSQYQKYKRFTPPEYQYVAHENIDLSYHDKPFLLNYYKAIEDVNGYVITQWSAHRIDVRNPEEDDEKTQAAVSKYTEKLGIVKFYENQLVQSKSLKEKGMTNADIKLLAEKGITASQQQEQQKKADQLNMFRQLFDHAESTNGLRLGSSNAFIYEIQKLLVSKGYDIPVDGVFENITVEAIRVFEEKNDLFPDGYIDALTLEHLLK